MIIKWLTSIEQKAFYERDEELFRGEVQAFLAKNGIALASEDIDDVYVSSFKGFSARLSDEQMHKLSLLAEIEHIEPDANLELEDMNNHNAFFVPTQMTDWGVNKVGSVKFYN